MLFNINALYYDNMAQFVTLLGVYSFAVYVGSRVLKVPGSENCKQLYMVLCDLSTMVQAVGRLSDHFTDDVFSSRLNDAQSLVTK